MRARVKAKKCVSEFARVRILLPLVKVSSLSQIGLFFTNKKKILTTLQQMRELTI